MRKLIYILGISLILTGCSGAMKLKDSGTIVPKKVNSIIDANEKVFYIDDSLKEVITEINGLREKYKDSLDQNESDSLYIDIYGNHNVVFHVGNEMFLNNQYFNDLVEILDKSLATGLKDHIKEMEDKEIPDNKVVLRKMGRVAVYAESREGEENFIYVKINFSDLADKDYRELLNKVSADKYLLDNMIMGDKLNMIDFVNLKNSYSLSYDDDLSIRYNMYLKDKDIEKVNILLQGRKGLELEQEDIDVFINLINTLELKEEDKDLLLNDYKAIFQAKPSNKKISLDNYNVIINATKGNVYLRNDRKMVYFSIERS